MFATLNRQSEMDNKLRDPNFVLVYQMGKVGSSTIEASLNNLHIPAWHIHTFDDNEEFLIYKNTQDVACFFNWSERKAYQFILSHRKKILQKRDELKIITLIRDPIATIVSRFFQDLHIQFVEGKKNQAIHKSAEETLAYLTKAFEENVNFDYFTHWFNKELERNFGIDIFKQIKDPTQPYWLIEKDNKKVLLLKCEQINASQKMINQFLNRNDITLCQSNEGSNKWYSELYRCFKSSYRFDFLFDLYDHPLYQTLYSPEEILSFKQKWSRA